MYHFAPLEPEARKKFEEDMLQETAQEYIPRDKVDYPYESNVKAPRSFCHISSEEEGFEWYQSRHPEVCDSLLRVMARYQFGTPPVSDAKNKRTEQKPSFSIEKKMVEISFDD